MSEHVAIYPPEPEQERPIEQPDSEAAQRFLEEQVPALCRLTGLSVSVEIGKGWATNPETGDFTIDSSFFTERGYTPEDSVYATLHELLAHVRDVKRDSVYSARQRALSERSEADHLFNNILTDIHGNRYMHNLLPGQVKTAAHLYGHKLMPTIDENGDPVDYAAMPLHIQFLYKMIREEMIPGSETSARPEVDAALASLRDYNGTGYDMIDYLTAPNSKMKGTDRFDRQLAIIYPVYQALLEQAKQEAGDKQAEQSGQSGEDSQSSESQDNQSGQDGQHQQAQDGSTNTSNGNPFAAEYADYFENKHPEPLSPEEEQKLDEIISQQIKQEQSSSARPNPIRAFNERIRQETGFTGRDYAAYATEVARYRGAIEEMRGVFQSVISERVAVKRGLSRRTQSDGDLLDPNRLAQTIIDMKSGITQPEAFTRYEHKRRQTEAIGKTDYVFVYDRSGSMRGERSQAAASSAVIMLEGLAGMQRDVRQAEDQYSLTLDLDIRTACYSFNDDVVLHKPLSEGITDKERLATYATVSQPGGNNADSVVLAEITRMPSEPDRRRILIVVSDGEADDVTASRRSVDLLREQGWLVYGVAIGSTAAERLYAPHSKLINDPNELPAVLQSFIESTIT